MTTNLPSRFACNWCGHLGSYPTDVAFRTVTLNRYAAARHGGPTCDVIVCADAAACEARQARDEDDREAFLEDARADS